MYKDGTTVTVVGLCHQCNATSIFGCIRQITQEKKSFTPVLIRRNLNIELNKRKKI